jgi:hypothetical protein
VEIPILHTWYRYGQFVPAGELQPQELNPKPLSEAHLPDATEMRKRGFPSPEEYKGYFLEHDLQSLLNQDWFEFLEENYVDYAPSPYKQLYLANLGVLELFEELDNDSSPSERGDYYYNQFKDYSVDLRAGIESNTRFDEETTAHVRESIHTIQDALLTLSTRDSVSSDAPVFRTRNFYHDYVWRWPAFLISTEQAKGVNREEFVKAGQRRLTNIKGACKDDLRKLNADLQDSGLNPTAADYRTAQGSAPEALSSLDRALLEASGNE